MTDVLRFWLDRGVDGFRIDVLWHIVKAEGLDDNPPNPAYGPHLGERDKLLQVHSTDQPEAHAITAQLRALADGYGDRVLIGEIFLPNDRLARWYGTPERPEVHLPFNFQLLENPWDAAVLRTVIADYEAALPPGGWPNWVIGSHDAARIAARLGERQARVAAMLILTLRGTPTLYQGDELGIGEVTIPRDRIRDPRELREPGLGTGTRPIADADAVGRPALCGVQQRRAVAAAERRLADAQRRHAGPRSGFDGEFLPFAVAAAARHPGAGGRRHHAGRCRRGCPGLYAGRRRAMLVALNMTGAPRAFAAPAGARCLINTRDGDGDGETGVLRADEGVVWTLEETA